MREQGDLAPLPDPNDISEIDPRAAASCMSTRLPLKRRKIDSSNGSSSSGGADGGSNGSMSSSHHHSSGGGNGSGDGSGGGLMGRLQKNFGVMKESEKVCYSIQ